MIMTMIFIKPDIIKNEENLYVDQDKEKKSNQCLVCKKIAIKSMFTFTIKLTYLKNSFYCQKHRIQNVLPHR